MNNVGYIERYIDFNKVKSLVDHRVKGCITVHVVQMLQYHLKGIY